MGEDRITSALARIEAAMDRIATAQANAAPSPAEPGGSAKVMALVNSHEKLREEVAETMRELDTLIADLEA